MTLFNHSALIIRLTSYPVRSRSMRPATIGIAGVAGVTGVTQTRRACCKRCATLRDTLRPSCDSCRARRKHCRCVRNACDCDAIALGVLRAPRDRIVHVAWVSRSRSMSQMLRDCIKHIVYALRLPLTWSGIPAVRHRAEARAYIYVLWPDSKYT